MVTLYMDHHVPSAITAGLRKRGVDVFTAEEDGSATLEDDPPISSQYPSDRRFAIWS